MSRDQPQTDSTPSSNDPVDPARSEPPKSSRSVLSRFKLNAVFVPILVVIVTMLGGIAWCGSFSAFAAAMRGQSLWVDAPVQTARYAADGKTIIASFSLRNLSTRPVRVVGSRTGCMCTIPEGLPMTIAAGSRASLRYKIMVDSPKNVPGGRLDVALFTNLQTQPELPLVILGADAEQRSTPAASR